MRKRNDNGIHIIECEFVVYLNDWKVSAGRIIAKVDCTDDVQNITVLLYRVLAVLVSTIYNRIVNSKMSPN